MINQPSEHEVLERLTRWAAADPNIRAALLYSSRANPSAFRDRFSDYDVMLAVSGSGATSAVRPYHENDGWLSGFGAVLVVFRNPIEDLEGMESFGYVVHYSDGVKIDYSFVPVEYLRKVADDSQIPSNRLPDDFDNGYRVLLDKDGLTTRLASPTYRAYTPAPPSESEYRAVIDEFFNDACYVAKHLRRGNLFNVKLSLDHIMKFTDVRQMLEWQAGIDCGWQIKTEAIGKGLKKRVDPETWAELERTYTGAGSEENWRALWDTISLFRRIARSAGAGLRYAYPEEQDRKVMEYLRWVETVEMG